MKNKNTKRETLEGKRTTFFLIGLTTSLALALVLFNIRSYVEPLVANIPKVDEILFVDAATPKTFMDVPKPPEEKKKSTSTALATDPIFIAMGNEIDLGDDFKEWEELEYVEGISEELIQEIDVHALSRKPVFPGCEQIADEEERFTCFKESMAKYVGKRLKPCSGAFGVTPEKMYAKFIVDENGRVTNIEIQRGQDPCNIDRVEEILQKLPVMHPGEHMGKKVRSRFVLPVNIH